MLATAIEHFDEDIQRSSDLCQHGQTLQPSVLRDDILRGAWMFAVGACDAYFSDAYADLIARTLQAKNIESNIQIPDRLNKLKIPVVAVLRQSGGGWRWRMAARELIENENVLSLEKIRALFNLFFPDDGKLLNKCTIEGWILHRDAKSRFFGITKSRYRSIQQSRSKGKAQENALKHIEDHFKQVFQRRHDCIHNCDRPKVALQRIADRGVKKKIEGVEFLVRRCHESFMLNFPIYLAELGFSSVTRNRVCQ